MSERAPAAVEPEVAATIARLTARLAGEVERARGAVQAADAWRVLVGRCGPADGGSRAAGGDIVDAATLADLGAHRRCLDQLLAWPGPWPEQAARIAMRPLGETPPAAGARYGMRVLQGVAELARRGDVASLGRFARLLQRKGYFDLLATLGRTRLARLVPPGDATLIRATTALWQGDLGAVRASLAAGTVVDADRDEADLLAVLASPDQRPGAMADQLEMFRARDGLDRVLYDLAFRWLVEKRMRAEARVDVKRMVQLARDSPITRLLHRILDTHDKGTPSNNDSQQHVFVLRALERAGWLRMADVPQSAAEERAFLWTIVDRFGGNRTDAGTFVEDGRLRGIDLATPRQVVTALQGEIRWRSLDDVFAEYAALDAEFPSIPIFRTYAAEILLWSGAYERAEADFIRAWEETRTRWSYMGHGACRLLRGDPAAAVRILDEGIRSQGQALEGEASFAYRADASLAEGAAQKARDEAIFALVGRPTRLRTWILLAELELRLGQRDEAQAALVQAVALCPGIFLDRGASAAPTLTEALVAAPATWTSQTIAGIIALAVDLRARMRGNASSWMYTWIDDGDDLRAFARVPPVDLVRALRAVATASPSDGTP